MPIPTSNARKAIITDPDDGGFVLKAAPTPPVVFSTLSNFNGGLGGPLFGGAGGGGGGVRGGSHGLANTN